MSLPEIHARLTDTATLFIAVVGLWALYLRIRSRPLDGNWIGAAVIGELLLIGQALLGTYLSLFMGLGVVLQRPFLHILYGIVAVITLPAAYGYFGQLEDENTKSVAMFVTCLFLWGILLPAAQSAYFPAPII